jgi:hypothetical protein
MMQFAFVVALNKTSIANRGYLAKKEISKLRPLASIYTIYNRLGPTKA